MRHFLLLLVAVLILSLSSYAFADVTGFHMVSGEGDSTAKHHLGLYAAKYELNETPWLYIDTQGAAFSGEWWLDAPGSPRYTFDTTNLDGPFLYSPQESTGEMWITPSAWLSTDETPGIAQEGRWFVQTYDGLKATRFYYAQTPDETTPPNSTVPEPLSSILFLTGAALLRFRKK